ncbi:heat shock 70 kDa protein-like isoform X2 [Raphanus sativus]|uniref:Heat shock 70 kDa protein-like isoform X2 n=1 Tax=Raphanus sativus TaxID=3726 RepID=A0A9W3CNP6_RAPSA|nr:heat shock 70 kDa protein-like isoform X2 [Raphanus sativus]
MAGKEERVEIIANGQGNITTPSYVTDNERLIGDDAKNQVAMNPINAALDAKRLLGPRFNDRSDWPSDFEAKPATRVFWDVNEFPVPLDMPPKNVYEKIKTCLVANDCYTDDLTIWAYVKKQHLSDHLVREYKENGITFLDEDDHRRSNWMVMDILLWTVDKPYINPKEITVIVLSLRISKLTELVQPLDSLYIRGYNVLLAAPHYLPPRFELATSKSSEWLAKALES